MRFLLIAIIFLAGCANNAALPSQKYAGISAVHVEHRADGSYVYDVRLGKEYRDVKLKLSWDGDKPSVQFSASRVDNAEQIRVAAESAVELQRQLSSMGVEVTDKLASTISKLYLMSAGAPIAAGALLQP